MCLAAGGSLAVCSRSLVSLFDPLPVAWLHGHGQSTRHGTHDVVCVARRLDHHTHITWHHVDVDGHQPTRLAFGVWRVLDHALQAVRIGDDWNDREPSLPSLSTTGRPTYLHWTTDNEAIHSQRMNTS